MKLSSNAKAIALRLTNHFCKSEQGNFAIIFALVSFVIVGFVGFAVDYSSMTAAKAELGAAADAAALAAVSRNALVPGASAATQIASSTTIASSQFAAAQKSTGTTITSSVATVTESNGIYTAKIVYQADFPLSFGNILGLSSATLNGTATATSGSTVGAQRFVDIYILMDASASMGIGATMSDINIMNSTVGMDGATGTCAVACHRAGTDAIAHKAGATLRFDVVKNAVLQIAQNALVLNGSSTPHIRMAVYSFADGFTPQIGITSNMSNVITAVNAMTLQGFDAGTNHAAALASLKANITTIGDGSTAASPAAYAILATDAIGNSVDNTSSSGWILSPGFVKTNPNAIPDPVNNGAMDLEGIDPSWCAPLTAAGINLMTLETKYLIAPSDLVPSAPSGGYLRFNYIQSTLLPNTSANMLACASKPSFAISADAPNEIVDAMQTLFQIATSSGSRLTQ